MGTASLEQRIVEFAGESPPAENDDVELKESWVRFDELRHLALNDTDPDHLMEMLEENDHYRRIEGYRTRYEQEGPTTRWTRVNLDDDEDVDETAEPSQFRTRRIRRRK